MQRSNYNDEPLRQEPSRTSRQFCLLFQRLRKVLDLPPVCPDESLRVHGFRLLCIQLKDLFSGRESEQTLAVLIRLAKISVPMLSEMVPGPGWIVQRTLMCVSC